MNSLKRLIDNTEILMLSEIVRSSMVIADEKTTKSIIKKSTDEKSDDRITNQNQKVSITPNPRPKIPNAWEKSPTVEPTVPNTDPGKLKLSDTRGKKVELDDTSKVADCSKKTK